MKILRAATTASAVAAAIATFAGCSTGGSQLAPSGPSAGGTQSSSLRRAAFAPRWSKPASLIPAGLRPIGPPAMHLRPAPEAAMRGIYAAEFYGSAIFGYTAINRANRAPICMESGVLYPNGIAVDAKDNLIDPDGGKQSIVVYNGPSMCGTVAGTIDDPYGQPADAASADAIAGTIVVGNIFGNSSAPGSISVCTLAGGCTTDLTNPKMYSVAGVALASNGDCWGDALDAKGGAHLVYFRACKGRGVVAKGFVNSYYGGLDIDAKGNLVTVDMLANLVYVYSGCNPACTQVGSPQALISGGSSIFGHLNQKSTAYATGDFETGAIDVYEYKLGVLTYAYSFNNGLAQSLTVEGVAYTPRSKQ